MLGAVVVALLVLAGRLVQLQGVDATAYADQAQDKRLRTTQLPAARGDVLDRHGAQLAYTLAVSGVVANPQQVEEPAATAAALAPLLGRRAEELRPLLTKTVGDKGERKAGYVPLAHGLDIAVGKQVAALDLAGISIVPQTKRINPGGDLAANVVGFVGAEGKGLAGVEDVYQDTLAGRDGEETVEVGSGGQPIPAGFSSSREPVAGRAVELTLDRDLQWIAQQALTDQVAATGSAMGQVIAIDVRTGEVLALAVAPTVDANDPSATPKERRGNPAISNVYEPGSVNKVIVAAAALETGTVTPDTELTLPPCIQIHIKCFGEAHERGTETFTFTGVLAKSSNVGTITVAQRMGKEKVYDYLREFGYGERSGLGFPGESAGILAAPDKWDKTQPGTIPIGQGVSVTAVQMASVYQTVANDGVRITPSLVRGTVGADGELDPVDPPARRTVIQPATAAALQTMLEAATSDEGTAPEARIDGYRVAGKTGTARRVNPDGGGYDGSYTSSFIGFAPADDPQVVVAAIFDAPQTAIYGGVVAAPVFRDVMSAALRSRAVPPTGTPPPAWRLMAE